MSPATGTFKRPSNNLPVACNRPLIELIFFFNRGLDKIDKQQFKNVMESLNAGKCKAAALNFPPVA
eukprot:287911-Pelagomonas_calceolata.AAC.2